MNVYFEATVVYNYMSHRVSNFCSLCQYIEFISCSHLNYVWLFVFKFIYLPRAFSISAHDREGALILIKNSS